MKLLAHRSVQLGSVRDCESISPALLPMQVATGEQDRQRQDNPRKGNGFAGGGPQTSFLSLSFLTDFSLV